MKYRIEIEMERVAILVVEADSFEQAEDRALRDVRDEDFMCANLYIRDVEQVTEGELQ